MHSASTHIYSLSLHDALPIWSQDFRTEPYTVQSHQIIGTVLQSGPKNLRPDRNFSVWSGLDRKLRSGPASLLSITIPAAPVAQPPLIAPATISSATPARPQESTPIQRPTQLIKDHEKRLQATTQFPPQISDTSICDSISHFENHVAAAIAATKHICGSCGRFI